MVAELIYLLCGVTSIMCSFMLFRKYRNSPSPLLFWSALGFVGLAANNIILCLDLIVLPGIDLSVLRAIFSLLGLTALVFGLIRETTR